MRKALRNSNLTERILAISLVLSLAAFGCTTNRTRGEGEPYVGGPSVGPSAPTSNTSGASVPSTPPPMTSSYRGNDQALATPQKIHRLTPDEAALIMANQLPRVRVLGPVNPGPAGRPYVSDGVITGLPSGFANQQASVNSSLNSPGGYAAITTGTDVNGASAAAVISGNLTAVTPTTAAIPVTVGAVSGGTTTGATTIGTTVTPTTTAASTLATPTTASSTIATPTTATNTATIPQPMTSSSAIGTGTATVSPIQTLNTNAVSNGNVRVQSTNGKVTVTNVGSSSGAKSQ